MYQRVLLFLTLIYSVFSAYGQNSNEHCIYSIKGRVTDSDSKLAIPGAVVWIRPGEQKLITDGNGQFTAAQLCEGRITIEIHALGYTAYNGKVTVNKNRTMSFNLHPADLSLNEVEVTGHRSIVPTPNTSSTISGNQLDQVKGGTLAEALQSISGVSMMQTGATIAKPVIHGLHSNRILTLNNGIRQEGQQWGAEHAPEIDPFIAKRITVIKGAESIRYGAEAIGGVVIVEPPSLPHQPDVQGEVNLVGASNGRSGTASAMLEGGIKQLPGLGWRVQGTMKKAGDVRTADYFIENTGVEEMNYSAALGYSNKNIDIETYYSHFQTDLGIYKGAHVGNINDLNARIEYGRPFFDTPFSYSIEAPMQKVHHDLIKLKAHLHLSGTTDLNAIYGYQSNKRQEYDSRRVLTGTPTLDMELNTHTVDVNVENFSSSGWKKIIGLNWQSQVNNNIHGTGVTPLIPNYDSYSYGAYGIVRLLKNSYELEAGLRYDHKHLDALGYNRNKELYGGVRNFDNISASLGGVLHLSNQWHLRSNIGSAWRPPVVSELYSDGLHHGTASYERGNADLKSERGYKWINSLEYSGNKLSIELDAYLNLIHNYIYLEPSDEYFSNIRGAFPTFDYRQTNARFTGLDLKANYRFSSMLDYQLNGSLVRARDTRNDQFLPWIPSDRVQHGIRFNFADVRDFSENFIRIQHQFVAKQTRYEPGSDYVSPPPAYHLFHVDAGTQWKTGGSVLSLNLSVNNFTNKLYKDYMNRFRYYTHDTGRNIVARATWRF